MRERYVTRRKQFRSPAFEMYLAVTELRLLDAPATLNGRRQGASTLQVLKSVAANSFPERSQQRRDSLAVARSAAVRGFLPTVARIRQHIILATDSGQHAVGAGTHAIRTANANIIALIRGGRK
jgi:hypothetical protein